jgi:hypothetical protein
MINEMSFDEEAFEAKKKTEPVGLAKDRNSITLPNFSQPQQASETKNRRSIELPDFAQRQEGATKDRRSIEMPNFFQDQQSSSAYDRRSIELPDFSQFQDIATKNRRSIEIPDFSQSSTLDNVSYGDGEIYSSIPDVAPTQKPSKTSERLDSDLKGSEQHRYFPTYDEAEAFGIVIKRTEISDDKYDREPPTAGRFWLTFLFTLD